MLREAIAWGFLGGAGVCVILAATAPNSPRFPWLVLFAVAFALIGGALPKRR